MSPPVSSNAGLVYTLRGTFTGRNMSHWSDRRHNPTRRCIAQHTCPDNSTDVLPCPRLTDKSISLSATDPCGPSSAGVQTQQMSVLHTADVRTSKQMSDPQNRCLNLRADVRTCQQAVRRYQNLLVSMTMQGEGMDLSNCKGTRGYYH